MNDKVKRISELANKSFITFYHHPNAYSQPVISCLEAALAREVSLEDELKHILLSVDTDFFLVHVPGNKRVDFNSVAEFTNASEIRLANLKNSFGTSIHQGAVFPFDEPFWSLPHLIDNCVLNKQSISTNDGTLRGYIKFNPNLLKLLPIYHLGEFSE